jgi:DNA-binding PadR family transcriptional regulator
MYHFDTSNQHLFAPREATVVSRKSGVLDLAVLGLLHESALHGYELSKRLKGVLGPLRAISYGSLYPCLNALQDAGLITTDDSASESGPGRRKKHVYKLTAEGKERLQEKLAEGGPSAWDDEAFGVRFAFFSQTDADVRLRILEGRRSRLEERQETASTSIVSTREKLDRYTLELQKHGLESVEREVRWLNELIATERDGPASTTGAATRPHRNTPAVATTTSPRSPATEGEHL